MTEEAMAQEAEQETPQEETTPERDYEKEALDMGWVPEEDFRGDKDKWKPAEQFVKDGEKILPIVRANEKRLREELKARESEFEQRIKRMEKMNEAAQARAKEQYEQEIARIKAAQLKAVEEGDTDAYKSLEERKEKLKAPDTEEPEDPATIQDAWIAKNKWYEEDDMMAYSAERFSQKLARDNPNLSMTENLAQTEAYIREKYPDHFGGEKLGGSKPKQQNGHAAVDSGGDFAGMNRKQTLADKLPPEARTQADIDIKAGLYKNREAWAKAYFG